jgi:hypothetical protein
MIVVLTAADREFLSKVGILAEGFWIIRPMLSLHRDKEAEYRSLTEAGKWTPLS